MRYNSIIGSGVARWESELSLAQRDFLEAEEPNVLFSGAYRAGKTEALCRKALLHALRYPGARVGILRNFLKSLKSSTLLTFLQLTPRDLVADWSNSEFVLRFSNGSRVEFLGCDDPDRIGSTEFSLAVVDEAHEVSQEAFTMVRGRLSLGVGDRRQLLAAANPKSKSHYLYEAFFSGREGHHVILGNTFENPYLPPDYLRAIAATYARPGVSPEEILRVATEAGVPREVRFDRAANLLNSLGRRNLLGLWGSSDAQIYPGLEEAQWEGRLPEGFDLAAVDWGYRNPRFLRARVSEGKLITHGYWAPENLRPSEFVRGIVSRCEGVSRLYLPPDQPGLIREVKDSLEEVRVLRAKTQVLPGISTVLSTLGKTLFFLPEDTRDFQVFYSELSGYEWKVVNGEVTDLPLKVDDHFPDALRYLAHSYLRRGETPES